MPPYKFFSFPLFLFSSFFFLVSTAFATECIQLDGADPTVPNVFSAGQPAVAADVNTNFDCLADELGALQKSIKTDSGNVGIGTATPTATLDVNGFTKLGDVAPALKVKLITGTTPASQGAGVSVAHGLDSSKIVSVSGGSYRSSDGEFAPFGQGPLAGNVEGRLIVSSTTVSVYLSASNSSSMTSKPFKILIWYTE